MRAVQKNSKKHFHRFVWYSGVKIVRAGSRLEGCGRVPQLSLTFSDAFSIFPTLCALSSFAGGNDGLYTTMLGVLMANPFFLKSFLFFLLKSVRIHAAHFLARLWASVRKVLGSVIYVSTQDLSGSVMEKAGFSFGLHVDGE